MRTLDVLLRYGPGTRPARLACAALPELIWTTEKPVPLDPGAAAALAIAAELDSGAHFAGVAIALRSALSLYDAHVDWEAGIEDLEDDQARDSALRALGIAAIAGALWPDDPVGELLELDHGEALVDWLVADLVLSQGTEDEPPEEEPLTRLLGHLDDVDLPEALEDRAELGREVLEALGPVIDERVTDAAGSVVRLAENMRSTLGDVRSDIDALTAEAREAPVYEVLAARLVAERGAADAESTLDEPVKPRPPRQAPKAPKKAEKKGPDPRVFRLAAILHVLPALRAREVEVPEVPELAVDRSALVLAEEALAAAEARGDQGSFEMDLGVLDRAREAARGSLEARNQARRAVQTAEAAIASTQADLDRLRRKRSANRAKSKVLVEARLMEARAVQMRVRAERAEVDTTPIEARVRAIPPEIRTCSKQKEDLPYIVIGALDVDQWPLDQAEAKLYEAENEAGKHPRPEPVDTSALEAAVARRTEADSEVSSARAERGKVCQELARARLAVVRRAGSLKSQAARLRRVKKGIGSVEVDERPVSTERLEAAEASIEEGYKLYEALPEPQKLDTSDLEGARSIRGRKLQGKLWARHAAVNAELAIVHTRWAIAKMVPERAAALTQELGRLGEERGGIELIEVTQRPADHSRLQAAEDRLAEATAVEIDAPTLDESPRLMARKGRRTALEAKLEALRDLRQRSRGAREINLALRDLSVDRVAARGDRLQLCRELARLGEEPDRSHVLEATTALRKAREEVTALTDRLATVRERVPVLNDRIEELEDRYDDIMRLRGLRRRRVRIMEEDLPVPAPPPRKKAQALGLVEAKTTMMTPEQIQEMLAELDG